jgi:hypothetical protein
MQILYQILTPESKICHGCETLQSCNLGMKQGKALAAHRVTANTMKDDAPWAVDFP